MRKLVVRGVGVLGVLFLAIQLVPVDRSNPPVEEEVPASPEARAVLRRACYDCHSNEVRWPWYARVAPVSWLIARDVSEGREALNYSTWNRLDAGDRREALEESWEETEEGEMPLWFYLPMHPEAWLSREDLAILEQGSRQERDAERVAEPGRRPALEGG
jgi:hypothetical protein